MQRSKIGLQHLRYRRQLAGCLNEGAGIEHAASNQPECPLLVLRSF
jgi:hypothetical protein